MKSSRQQYGKLVLVAALSLLAVSTGSYGQTVTRTLSDIDGPENDDGTSFPVSIGTWTFDYVLPANAGIISAALSGTYGTQEYQSSTAGFDVNLEGSQFSVCAPLDPTCWHDGAPLRPFSIDLPVATFAGLMDGSATMEVIQTNRLFVRFGSPTLTINYAPVPEPISALLLLIGLPAIAFRLNRTNRTAPPKQATPQHGTSVVGW